MKTSPPNACYFALLIYCLTVFSPPMLDAQKVSGHDFIRWRLKTTGPAYLSFDDKEALYLTVNSTASEYSDELILAISASDGVPKWTYQTEKPMMSVTGKSGNLIYVHAGGAAFTKNITVVLNAASGKGVWHIISADNQKQSELKQGVFLIQTGGLDELAAFSMQQGLFGNADKITGDDLRNKIVAMDYLKGEEIWRIYLDTIGGPYNNDQLIDIEGSWTPFCVRGNMLFFSSSLYLAAADVSTGKTLWVNRSGQDRWDEEDVQPIIDGRRSFFGGPDISALNLLSGQTIWRYPLDTLLRARLLLKSDPILLAEIEQSINPMKNDSSNYSLLAIDMNTGKKLWQNDIDSSISEININGKSIQYKTKDKVTLRDLYDGRKKYQVDVTGLRFWLSPDGTFILSGGKDSIVSLLRPDGTMIDTLHFDSPIRNVFRTKNFQYLLVSLQSGELLALESRPLPSGTSLIPSIISAEDMIRNTKRQILPPLRTITPTDSEEIKLAKDRLRYKRYGFTYEYASVQQCNEGCSEGTGRQSFGLSYKRYYGRWWALQPELFYMRRGGKGLKVNHVDAFEYDLRYLNFHLLGEVGTPSDWRTRLYFLGGPYYGYPIYSKYEVRRQNGSIENYPFSAQHDYGLIAGLGLDLAFKKWFLFAEFRGHFGLRRVVSGELPTPGATLARGKNTAAGFTLGIGF